MFYFNWCTNNLNFLLHQFPKHHTRHVRVSAWNHSHVAPSLAALCLLKGCAQHFISNSMCKHNLPSIFLLKSALGTSPSKGTPDVGGLFLSFPLYYNNDLNLLINIISLLMVSGTIWPVTSFSIHKLSYPPFPMAFTSQGLSTKTWFISHPT